MFGEEIMKGEDGFEISTDVGRHVEPFKESLETVKHLIDRLRWRGRGCLRRDGFGQ
jgi:hypothetical protein